MELSHRIVQMFRCYRPPLIGPTPKLAYMPKDSGLEAIYVPNNGVYVKEANGMEHLVPLANIESLRFEPLTMDLEMKKKAK